MAYSYTSTATESFTVTHARHIAAKVSTDLLRFTRFYRNPSIEMINKYEEELVALLKADYLDNVTYGFKRDGMWVEALRYHAIPGGILLSDDDPWKIRPGTDVPGENFGSYLVRNNRWRLLASAEREAFESSLPFRRDGASEPALASGIWSQDRAYSAQGRGIARSVIIR